MKKIILPILVLYALLGLSSQANATILGGGEMFHSLVASTTTANEYIEIKDTLKLDPSEPPSPQEITQMVYYILQCGGANPIGEITNVDIMGSDPPCGAGTGCCGTQLNLAPYYDLIEQELFTNGSIVLTITVLMYDAGTDMEAVLTREMDYIDLGDGLFKELDHDNTVPLPPLYIELSSFSARQAGDNVLVNWETTAEVDNDYFVIERSSDAITYKAIAWKMGAGNSTHKQYYEVTDSEPDAGYNYYRLRSVSFSEEENVTDAIPVLIKGEEFLSKVYPTTFSHGINILTPTKVDVAIYSLLGEEVFSIEGVLDDYIELSHLVSGIYYVQLTEYEKILETQKIIKQ